MSAPEPQATAAQPDDSPVPGLVEAGCYPSSQEGFDHGLVVLALGFPCWLMPAAGGFQLLVEPATVGRVRTELASYDRELAGWQACLAPPVVESSRRLDLASPLGWAAVVVAVFRLQVLHPDWTDRGVLDAERVVGHGEWWRAATALFLHGSAEHLASNLIAGIFVFATVLTVFGRARGWLLLTAAAVTANLGVAFAQYPAPYHSLGASTAIFAALGLLTGRAVRVACDRRQPHRGRPFFAPAAAGLILLALYGAGGAQVDALAHGAGFLAGGLLGWFVPARPVRAGGTNGVNND